MKLEDQLTSLELSVKLKELGVAQDSVNYWMTSEDTGYSQIGGRRETDRKDSKRKTLASAFSVAELGELIGLRCMSMKTKVNWFAGLAYPEGTRIFTQSHPNEVEARGHLFIYMIENKVEVPQ